MKTRALFAAIIVAALVAAPLAWGQADGPADTLNAPADEGGYLPAEQAQPASLSVLDVLWKLALAVLIACAAIRAVRWFRDSGFGSVAEGGRGSRHMWLEESLSLGSDGRLYLVEVEGRRVLLAAREGSVARIADLTDEPPRPSSYRSVRTRADGSTDELNIRQAGISTSAVRPDIVGEDESWEERRGRLLRELQEQG